MTDKHVTVEALGSAFVVVLEGGSLIHTAVDLNVALSRLLDRGEKNVVVDMGKVGSVTSTILSVLAQYTEDFRGIGGELSVCAATDKVRQILDVLGLDKFLALIEDRKEALSAGAGQAGKRADRRRAPSPFQGQDRRKGVRRNPVHRCGRA